MPPSSPSDLEVVSSTAESLLLAWTTPDFTGFSPLAGVRVAVREESSGSLVDNLMLEGPIASYNVTSLQPLRDYAVDIYIRNQAGLEGELATVLGRTASLSKTNR